MLNAHRPSCISVQVIHPWPMSWVNYLDQDTGNAQTSVNQAMCQMFVNAGLNPAYALGLPRKLEQAGFHVERAQAIMHLCPGNSPMANVMGESALVLEQEYCHTGLCSPQDIRHMA